jgi:membrane fusion protein, copper/silver efflux system
MRTGPIERRRPGISLNRPAKIALSELGALVGPELGNNPEKKGNQGIHRLRLSLEGCSLLILILVGLGACSKPVAPIGSAKVDYWTCAMHPSVRSENSGKCPICGMDLIPVMSQSREPSGSASNSRSSGDRLVLSQLESSKKRSAQADDVDNSKPRQFFVPVESQQQFGVSYTEVRRRQMRLRIRSFGTLDVDQAEIFECVSHVDGYIEELQVTSPGERVTVGQPLMAIYTPDLRSSEQELASLLKVEESGNVPAESMTQLIDSARRRLRRMDVSENQISELERTKQPTDLLLVRSPCDGIVSEAPLKVGLSVKHGDKLIGLFNLSRLWLWVNFYEDEVNLLKEGELMTMVFPALANRSFEGKISVITATIDPVKRTTLVRIDIPNPDDQLRPGMSANVTTEIDAGEGLTIPFESVLPAGSQMLVFVQRGLGKLEPRLIRVGRQSVECADENGERYYQVIGGLQEGERIVSGGNFLIDAEAQVQGALRNFQEEQAPGSIGSDSSGQIGEK